jgi:hypothetical protein
MSITLYKRLGSWPSWVRGLHWSKDERNEWRVRRYDISSPEKICCPFLYGKKIYLIKSFVFAYLTDWVRGLYNMFRFVALVKIKMKCFASWPWSLMWLRMEFPAGVLTPQTFILKNLFFTLFVCSNISRTKSSIFYHQHNLRPYPCMHIIPITNCK